MMQLEAGLNKSVKFYDQVNDEEKCVMSMVQAEVTKTLNQKSDQQSQGKTKVSRKSILKHAKNNGSSLSKSSDFNTYQVVNQNWIKLKTNRILSKVQNPSCLVLM